MNRGYATFIALSFLSAALITSTWAMVYRLTPAGRGRYSIRWLSTWSIKGLVLPIVLWVIMNIGISRGLQPFMPEVQFAKDSGQPWGGAFFHVVGYGLFIVSSYWMVLTLGWAVYTMVRNLQGQQRADFKSLCFTCFLGLFLPAIGIGFLGGWPIIGLALGVILIPIAGYAPGILFNSRKTAPAYTRAISRMKFGKYKEAEWEIIRELEKAENDFEGWMMLAELYAKNFNDVPEAEQTVLEICDQPATTPSQLSVALHRLSDWHLNLDNNPDAARRALQMICNRLPHTHLAHMAQLRINQLPKTVQELRELHNPKPVPLPDQKSRLDVTAAFSKLEMDRDQAVAAANACVEKLNFNPNEISAREKLAHLLAERLGQVEDGLEQLTLLLNLPDAPDPKRAEWLSLSARWQIAYRQDPQTGRKIYERLLREFPQSPEAAAAWSELQTLATD